MAFVREGKAAVKTSCDRQNLFVLKGLSLSYAGRAAFRPVSGPIRRGRLTAILGPSGCGKSSLLSALNRLDLTIPGARVDGRLLFDGRDLVATPGDLRRLRRRIARIFQTPAILPLSIADNFHLPLKAHGVRDAQARDERMRAALAAVGLLAEIDGELRRPAEDLSGGQQQRLCLARALALAPDVLLLDEPTSHLDPLSAERVEATIRQLKTRLDVVLVTHDLGLARRLADDVWFFWSDGLAGYCAEQGPAARLLHRPDSPELARFLAAAGLTPGDGLYCGIGATAGDARS